MSKKIKQFRYYSKNDSRNSPDVDMELYHNGSVFGGVFPILQLGIQTLPGVEFLLNGSVNPITIGSSGIYDLEVKNGARITGLAFQENSLERINNSDTGYLIVDVLYDDGGEE